MGKIALVFSGQGAQYTGMGRDFYESSPAAKAVFDRLDALRPNTSSQCFTADKETLSQTITTQPCVFAANYAAAAAVAEAGIRADYLAGFSLGEVSALAFGGYLTLEQAFSYVCRRGEEMDKAAKAQAGAMFAVMAKDLDALEQLCAGMSGAYPVNYNCPGQTVVSCHTEQADAFAAAAKAAGMRAMKLAVSGGFHSPMMLPAADALAAEFAPLTLAEPTIPVIANATARPYECADQMFLQIHTPVYWQRSVESLIEQGVTTFIEVGVDKTLTGLIGKISKDVTALTVENQEGLQRMLEVLA